MHVVLFQPEIPGNTGNVARLTAATATELHLIRPLGFSLADKYLKRAGLDYWEHVRLSVHDTLDELIAAHPDSTFWYLSTKVEKPYTKAGFGEDDFIVFGPETKGLPEEMLAANAGTALTIPMFGDVRSINLSTSVGIVLYEALRQVKGF